MIRSILVPLDGSKFAEHSLPCALAIARRAGAQIRLVTVVTPLAEAYVEGLYFSTAELQDQIAEQQQAYLDRVAARLRERAEVTVTTEVLHGEVSAVLNHHIDKGGIDLVILATHGRGALGRFWLGSVADEMLRHVSIPLLLVRPGEGEADLTSEPPLGRAVIALDGTPLAEQILGPALAVAALLPDASVTLMRAVHPVTPIEALPDVPDAMREAQHLRDQMEQMQAKLRKDASAYLEGVAPKVRSQGLKVTTEVLAEDQPASAILREAAAVKAGMIAIATHARAGLSRMVLGSVADKVIRGAHVPVLVYHPKVG